MRNIYHSSYSSLQSLFLSNACDQRSLPYLKAFLPHQTQIVRRSPAHTNFMLLENYSCQINWARSFAGPVHSVGHDMLLPEGRLMQGEDVGAVRGDASIFLRRGLKSLAPEGPPGMGHPQHALSLSLQCSPEKATHGPGGHCGSSQEMLLHARSLPAPFSNSGARKRSCRLGTGARGLGTS